jgi:hypothetical protein
MVLGGGFSSFTKRGGLPPNGRPWRRCWCVRSCEAKGLGADLPAWPGVTRVPICR